MSHTTEAILAGTWGEGCPSCSDSGYDILIHHAGRRSLVYSDEPTPDRAKRQIRQDYPNAEIIRVSAHPKMARHNET